MKPTRSSRRSFRFPWRRSIRARLLSLVLLPVVAGACGIAAFLVVATGQQDAEDAVRRTLAVRAITQEASAALEDLDTALWSQYFPVAGLTGTPPTANESRQRFASSVSRLRELTRGDSSFATLLDGLDHQVDRKLELYQTLGKSLVKEGKIDLGSLMANPALWQDFDAPDRSLAAIDELAGKELQRQTGNAQTGRIRLQLAVPLLVGLGLLVSLSLAVGSGRKLARRVEEVERNARRLAAGDALAPVTAGVDEVARLARELEAAAHLLASREAEIRQAMETAERANKAKSEFLSRMSHELRTPLNSILGFGQLLEMSDRLEPDDIDAAHRILTGGRHLLALIDDVLDVSRIEVGALELSLEPVNLEASIRNAIDLITPMAAQRKIRIVWDRSVFSDSYVMADARRFSQVLLNLLSNAVKFNVDGGAVTIGLDHANDRFRVHISDTGAGIGAEHISRLFVPFERLGAERAGIEGTGLGLALSKRLVEAMQGEILVESALGSGSTFSIDLPTAERSVEALVPDEAVRVAPQAAGRTVLYIEDNLANLKLLERVLEHRPRVRLLSAMQGRLGIELARQHRPDLVLLDLHLPDLRGEEVLERLRGDERTASLPVVVISADATPRRIGQLKAAGVHAYLTKPFEVGALLRVLDEVLASAEPEATEAAVG